MHDTVSAPTEPKQRALLPENWPGILLALGAHLAVLALWWLATTFGGIPSFILPSPGDTVKTLFDPGYQWGYNTFITATEIFVGYALAIAIGVLTAMIFTWFRLVRATLLPLFITISMVPKVALGPLLIVWFGYGVSTNIFFAFLISFFPILITTARGLREVEPDLLDLVRALKGTRWQIFTKIQLPGALPYIFSAMKVGAILAVAGAIVGEFVASSEGLGYLMIQVQSTLDTAAMFMAVLLLSLLGVALFGFVLLLEKMFVVKDARLDQAPS